MKAVRAIAINTFKEAIRNKILYSLIFFAFVMMLVSLVLDHATVGQRNKIIKDLGLGSINLFGVVIAIVVGINLVYQEIQKRTIYPLLAKPVCRAQFLVGKYLGIVLTLFVETLLMSLFLFMLVLVYEGAVDFYLSLALFMIFVELAVVSAVAIFFSSFSTPFLSGMFTFAVYVIGHLSTYLKQFGHDSESLVLKQMTAFFYYILPNLERFNWKAAAVYHLPVENTKLLLTVFYGLIYIATIIILSVLSFERRDFK